MRFTVSITESGGGVGGATLVEVKDLTIPVLIPTINKLLEEHDFFNEDLCLELNIEDALFNIYDAEFNLDNTVCGITWSQFWDPATMVYQLVGGPRIER